MDLGTYYRNVWARAGRDTVAFLKAQVVMNLVLGLAIAGVTYHESAGIGEPFNPRLAVYALIVGSILVVALALLLNILALSPWHLYAEQASRLREFESRLDAGRAHRGALRAEIEICKERAEGFSGAGVRAPSYRLPTARYEQSFQALLENGVLSEPGAKALMEFFAEVETLNRGLDLVQAARERGDDAAREAEYKRNRLKAQNLLSLYNAARAAVD
jgi:hypothetical protein